MKFALFQQLFDEIGIFFNTLTYLHCSCNILMKFVFFLHILTKFMLLSVALWWNVRFFCAHLTNFVFSLPFDKIHIFFQWSFGTIYSFLVNLSRNLHFPCDSLMKYSFSRNLIKFTFFSPLQTIDKIFWQPFV